MGQRIAAFFALLVFVVGCNAPSAGTTIEVSPGPVATVTQGNLLQLAAWVPGEPHTYELVIDDTVAALFDVHDVANLGAGAILTLVPGCGATGTVSMGLRTEDDGLEPIALSIQIAAEVGGVCAGAPEHVITSATLQVANLPVGGDVLCTRTTALVHSARDAMRPVLRTSVSVPNHTVAPEGRLVCGADSVVMDLWPPIDAPAVELVSVETFNCDTTGCEGPASTCCDAHAERLTALTSTKFGVAINSASEFMHQIDGVSVACADLDANGTPEVILAGVTAKLTTEIGNANRFTQHLEPVHANGLIAFSWQASATTVEPVVLAGFGAQVKRAQLVNGAVSWGDEARIGFPVGDPAQPDSVLPLSTSPTGGVRYVARLAGGLELTCISPTCTEGTTTINLTLAQWLPMTIGTADVDGDGSEDVIVVYRPSLTNVGGSNPVLLRVFAMTWEPSPAATSFTLGTLDVPSLAVQLVRAPSAGACDRLYLLSGDSQVFELNPTVCGATPVYTHHVVPTPNQVYAIENVSQRVVISSALGMFELEHSSETATQIRQVDPLLQEQLATSGSSLVDPTFSAYGTAFASCLSATPSIVYQIKRGDFEWSALDAQVDGFSVP